MSGDSYDKCPVCKNLPEKWRQGVDHLYGNVTREEFANIEKEYNELIRVECVREDYVAGIHPDGTASVSFEAVCENCGTTWRHIVKDIPGVSKPR